MAFPPPEELLNYPTRLVDGCNLLCGKVKTIRGNPKFFIFNPISDDPHLFLGLVDAFSAKQSHSIIKNDAILLHRIEGSHAPSAVNPDAANKMPAIDLPLIKTFVALIIAVHNTSLAGR